MGKREIKFNLVFSTRGFTGPMVKAQSAIRAFNQEMARASRMAKEVDRGLTGMAGKFSALFGGISTVAFGKSIWDAGVAMQGLERGFKSITGSSQAAASELDYIRQLADDLGLSFQQTASDYMKISAAARGTALEGKATRDIILGISEASTVLGLSADQTSGALNAISQMISKGKVQAEELRGQLGERLPGAFQLAAKAMGVTTAELDKMLEQGQVTATDLIPKLSQALHDLYGKSAIDQADGAIQALNRFGNAWLELKASIAESGFLDVATGRIKDFANAMNDPEIKQRIVELTTNFFKLADAVLQFTINHGKVLAKVSAGLIALSALSRAAHLLNGVWLGLNAAMLQITGSRLLPYLGTLRNSLGMAQIATMGLTGALGAAAGATLSLMTGFKVGEWLYKWTEPAERELSDLQFELEKTAAKYRQFAFFVPESSESLFAKSEKDLKRYKEQLVGAYRYQSAVVNSLYAKSRDTTIWGNATKEAKQAEIELIAARERLKSIKRAMDEYASVAEKAHKKAADAAGNSATDQSKVTGKALEEMKRKYQQYADEVKRLQDEIAGREKSLAEQLRAMARTGMDDLSAWRDRKKEAEEYEAAARKAAEAGDFTEAAKLADKARQAYADLNKEVKDGDQVLVSQQEALKTAMDGVKRAGELGIEILRQQTQATKDAASALDEQADGQLSEQLTDAARVLGEMSKKTEQYRTKLVKVNEVWKDQVVGLKKVESEIEKIVRKVDELDGRKIKLDIVERTVQRRFGGSVGFARGGKLAGYGGGDRIPALLEAGEYVIRKEAVARFGAGIFHALNNLRLPDIPRFATGGLAGAGAGVSGDTVTINFSFPGEQSQPQGRFSREDADNMVRIMKRQQRLRSR